ncbi:UDP-2,4-diacetamido-2,4,6-trideoxy-beta-L-altropyranose hydrolase [Caulobacter sp. KR2-114]|uniref:UDP-2,4-diacetamido-2,4, 6-trideoxy-beta-L-altropyranose hydrolase n=1 Tax=Caulobacter sp. KR2-114 TaxID=3400912 RepID=UPI003C115018
MPAGPRILFFADAGPQVGGGHVMRCLTLARALGERGAECAFVESRAAAGVLRRFGWPAGPVLAMSNTEDLPGLVRWGQDFAASFQPDVVVVDHYRAGAAEETALSGGGARRVVVIDDLADRPHACALLLDPGFGRRREDYAGLVAAGCEVLTGPDFALVRPAFAAARPRSLSRRARHEPPARALVALGLTDVGGVTLRVVEALAPVLGEVRLDVVLGSGAPSLEALNALAGQDRRIRLHVDSTDMAALTATADLAIGAGGSSVWERATVGLPTATVVLAENQAPMAQALAAAGLTLALDARAPGFEAALVAAWSRLTGEPDLRWSLTTRSSELCDGRGAERAAVAILALA